MENSFQNTVWTLRVQSHAVQFGQCPCNISGNDEQDPERILGSRGGRLLRRHSHLFSELSEHVELVKKVLARLEEHLLAISLKKSVFHVPSVEFLGYIVAVDGVTISERKVESIKKWRSPRSVKEVQIFIGFANFYRRFIKDFSKICKPITETLEGNPRYFSWGKEQAEAFEELKHRFTTAPILAHFYPERETVVETDASDFALGCVLSQFLDRRQHPVAFHS